MSKKKILKKSIRYFIKRFLDKYDYIYLTSDLRGFISHYGVDPNEICQILFSELIRKKKTVIVPAFSYKNKGRFYVDKTESNLGFLTKWALRTLTFIRSEHPVFSVISVGKDKKITKILENLHLAMRSFFYRLFQKKTSLMHFGRPFSFGNTVIHFVEQITGAFYRENIVLKTRVFNKKRYLGKDYSIFARKGKINNQKYDYNTKKIAKIIKKNKMIYQIGQDKNLTNITHIDMKACVNLMCSQFYLNNKIFLN